MRYSHALLFLLGRTTAASGSQDTASPLPMCALPWEQIGTDLTGLEAANELGRSVALSADGRIMAVGEPLWRRWSVGEGSGRTGRVRVYALKKATEWFEKTEWEPFGGDDGVIYIDDERDDDYGELNGFGLSVSLSSDGRTVVVGVPYSDDSCGSGASYGRGSVRVYSLTSDDKEWIPLGNRIRGNSCGDLFGWSLGASSDGRTVAVGARSGNIAGNINEGYAQVYSYDAGDEQWVQRGHNIKGEGFTSEKFGSSVSISADGRIVAVGSDSTSRINKIRVYYYEEEEKDAKEEDKMPDECKLNPDSQKCQTLLTLMGLHKDRPKGLWNRVGDDIEGETVSLSNDGRTMAVGNPDVNGKTNVWNNYRWDSGAVRVYYYQSEEENQAPGWTQVGTDIIGENEDDYAGSVYGGHPVAISGDGMTVVMGVGRNAGAPTSPSRSGDGTGTNVGHARVFTYDSKDEDWRQVGVDIDGYSSEDKFGDAVAVSDDGRVVAVGARQDLKSNGDIANFVRGSGYARAFTLAEGCASPPSPSPTDPIWSLSHISLDTITDIPTYSPTALRMPSAPTTSAPTDAPNEPQVDMKVASSGFNAGRLEASVFGGTLFLGLFMLV